MSAFNSSVPLLVINWVIKLSNEASLQVIPHSHDQIGHLLELTENGKQKQTKAN